MKNLNHKTQRVEIKIKGAYQDEFEVIREKAERLLGTQTLTIFEEGSQKIIITNLDIKLPDVFKAVNSLKKDNSDIYYEVYSVIGRGQDKEIDLLKAV